MSTERHKAAVTFQFQGKLHILLEDGRTLKLGAVEAHSLNPALKYGDIGWLWLDTERKKWRFQIQADDVPEPKKKRGRPKGSKNKKNVLTPKTGTDMIPVTPTEK